MKRRNNFINLSNRNSVGSQFFYQRYQSKVFIDNTKLSLFIEKLAFDLKIFHFVNTFPILSNDFTLNNISDIKRFFSYFFLLLYQNFSIFKRKERINSFISFFLFDSEDNSFCFEKTHNIKTKFSNNI